MLYSQVDTGEMRKGKNVMSVSSMANTEPSSMGASSLAKLDL